MIGWFRPWMAWAAAVLALAGALSFQTVRLSETKADLANADATIAKMKRDSAQALADAHAKARATETELRDQMDLAAAQFAKEKADATAREDALVESVRSGARRLSIAVARCVPATARDAQDPAPAERAGPDEARAELDPATSERILAIPRDGDQSIRERNACFERYEQVRKLINGE